MEGRATLHAGGQPRYSALAITTALTLRAVFRLAQRQIEGLIASLLRLLGVDLAVVEYTLAPAARPNRIVAEVRRRCSGSLITALTPPGSTSRPFSQRSPNRDDDDAAPRGPRRARDQRDLRSAADTAQLSQREAGSRRGGGRAQ
jgi:hypothetical protein